MTEEQKQRVVEERSTQEQMRRPTTKPSTKAASATTQPIDIQLQRAVDTLVLTTILQTNPRNAPIARTPSTRPVNPDDH